MRSKDYIFKKNNDKLELVGDFEGFYKNNEDPWDQISVTSDMSEYYKFSRTRLIKCINSLPKSGIIVEVGSGLGIVTDMINKNTNNFKVIGIDISETAVKKAKSKYNDIDFYVADITSNNFKFDQNIDVLILNQMLWYVLHDFDQVMQNVYNTITKNGYLIITMAFLEEQNYGKEIINGFYGLIDYCKHNLSNKFEIFYSDVDESNIYDYQDGIVCLKKINNLNII